MLKKLVLFALLLVPSVASATILEYRFIGHVTPYPATCLIPCAFVSGFDVSLGDMVNGVFGYDTSLPWDGPNGSLNAMIAGRSYSTIDNITRGDKTLGESTFGVIGKLPELSEQTKMGVVMAGNGTYFGCYTVGDCTDYHVPLVTEATLIGAMLQVRSDGSGLRFPITAGAYTTPWYLNARLDYVEPVKLPVPSSLLLLSTGFVVMLLWKRKKAGLSSQK
jgi:hypothetical protein